MSKMFDQYFIFRQNFRFLINFFDQKKEPLNNSKNEKLLNRKLMFYKFRSGL